MPLSSVLLKQHHNQDITLAIPLIEKSRVNYLVIEYNQENWQSFFSLVKHLFKNLNIENYTSFRNNKKELLQIFIHTGEISLDDAYNKVEEIKHLLNIKSKKSYKILPNRNLPKNYNIITLPQEKI